jgi:hypothetical protein
MWACLEEQEARGDELGQLRVLRHPLERPVLLHRLPGGGVPSPTAETAIQHHDKAVFHDRLPKPLSVVSPVRYQQKSV